MDYGITLRRDSWPHHPTPLTYLTNFARAASRWGSPTRWLATASEAGLDCLTMLSVIAEASSRTETGDFGDRPTAARHHGHGQAVRLAGSAQRRPGASPALAPARCSATMKSSEWTPATCGPASKKAYGRCGPTRPRCPALQGPLLRYDRRPTGAAPPEPADLDRELGQ